MANLPKEQIDVAKLQEFANLELLAKAVVEGTMVGLHKSPFHGFSVEFLEHRQYNPGDSIRNIDWKLFARTEKLFVKKYEEETNLRCHVLMDTSSSMVYPQGDYNKFHFSIYSAAALTYLLNRQRDATGMTFFSDQIEESFPPRSTTAHRRLLFTEMEKRLRNQEEQKKNKKTATAQVLHEIAETISKRSLIILFSDMMDTTDDQDKVISALQHLKYNKHQVILFHVMDKESELNFDFENRPYNFVDMETGEQIKAFPGEIREKYLDYIKQYHHEIQLKCGQFGIEYVQADIQEGFRQIILPFLKKRARMM